VGFSEPMLASTITSENIRLRATGGSSDVPALVTYAGTTATLTPNSVLSIARQYQVTVSGQVRDLHNNPLGSDVTWTFTTGAGTFTDTSVADFTAGTPGSGTYIAETNDGEVILAPTVGAVVDNRDIPDISLQHMIAVMLWIVGRAIQAAARVDKLVRKEFDNLRKDFAFSLGILPGGPYMFMGKDKKGRIKYLGWNPKGKKTTLQMGIRNMEAGFLVFTFQESTAVGFAHSRFVVEGDLSDSLAVVRVLDLVEVLLLPWFITKLAVKRYPKWSELSPFRKYLDRVLVYIRAFTF